MGYITLTKGKYPAFLTISRLNALLEELRKSGKCPEANFADELFGGKSIRAANRAIRKYLKEYEKKDLVHYFSQYYEFSCKGEEAKDNLYSLLDAAAIVHHFSGFRSKNSSGDIRFPYGKKYSYVVSIHKKSCIEYFINTDELVEFYGNLNCFVVVFQNYSIVVDHGGITLFSSNTWKQIEELDPKDILMTTKKDYVDFDDKDSTQSCCLENDDDINTVVYTLSELFEYYKNHHRNQNVEQISTHIIEAIRAFSRHNAIDDVSLSLELRVDDEYRYLSFSVTNEDLTVTDAGHIYDPRVGGDSFTNWSFTLCEDGTRDGSLLLDIDTIKELINMGAQLEIDCNND